MQYCPKCQVQIRGRKARCPLCQGELLTAQTPDPVENEDPFAQIPRSPVSYMLMFRIVSFLCISVLILFWAAQIISGFTIGWIYVASLGILAGWADVLIAVYYRSNILKVLTTQAYLLMGISILIDVLTLNRGWAVSWFVPIMFLVLVIATFAIALGHRMELYEYILYLAFDVLMSLLQIIPIVLKVNRLIAPAVICIALMLILVSGLFIFRGKMLRSAVIRYLHI